MRKSAWFSMFLTGAVFGLALTTATPSARAADPVCEPEKVAEKYPSLAGKKLRIGADPQTQPFVFRDPNDFNNLIGFDAELAREVFQCAGVDFEFFLGGWSGLVPAVMAGQIDAMWDALYYLPERAEKLDFVSYMQAGIGALVRPGNPHSVKSMTDLCGHNVSVLLGTVEEATVKKQDETCKAEGKPAMNIMVGPDTAAVSRLLQSERVEVFVIDLGLAGGLSREKPEDFEFAFRHLTGITQAVGIPKGRDDLVRAIHDGLRVAQAKGIQQTLHEKYGMDPALQVDPKILTE